MRRRLCCHDETGETVTIDDETLANKIIDTFDKGSIPKNCLSCKKLEDIGAQSPRQEYLQKFTNVNRESISYLDYTVDNICNLKCRSCRPSYSKLLEKEFKELNIPFTENPIMDPKFIIDKEDEIIQKLNKDAFITLTGGEPFKSKNTENFINRLRSQKNTKEMSIRFFTNGTHIPDWFECLFKEFKFIEIMVSLDGANELAEYLRYPSKWNTILENIRTFIKMNQKFGNSEISFHCVLQAGNFTRIPELIESLTQFKNQVPFVPNFTTLAHPSFMVPSALPKILFKKTSENLIVYLKDLKSHLINDSHSYLNQKNINSLIAIIEADKDSNNSQHYIKFMAHTKKIDHHRNQDISLVLPELFKAENK